MDRVQGGSQQLNTLWSRPITFVLFQHMYWTIPQCQDRWEETLVFWWWIIYHTPAANLNPNGAEVISEDIYIYIYICIWVGSWKCVCLVTWFCYQRIAKPGHKTTGPPWPNPCIHAFSIISQEYLKFAWRTGTSLHHMANTIVADDPAMQIISQKDQQRWASYFPRAFLSAWFIWD